MLVRYAALHPVPALMMIFAAISMAISQYSCSDTVHTVTFRRTMCHRNDAKLRQVKHPMAMQCHSYVHRGHGGMWMPTLGFGTGGSTSGDLQKRRDGVTAALAADVRHIDTAQNYRDEAVVADAIRASGVPRQSVWITSKWQPPYSHAHAFNATVEALRLSLARMKLDYLNEFLLHTPCSVDRLDQWRGLLYARDELKLVRSVGVSNYEIRHLEDLRLAGLEMPAVNQMQLHPWMTRDADVAYAAAHGIVIEAWKPLGLVSKWSDPVVTRIAKAHAQPIGAVMLRWSVQRGIVPIFGTDSPAHLQADLRVYAAGFKLSDDEMTAISGLNQNLSAPGYEEQMKWSQSCP